MAIVKNNDSLEKWIIDFYFTVASVEDVVELFAYKPLLFFLKPLISILLMILYWNTSNERNKLFFATIFFSLITNVFLF
ncbi:hypothetical protein [Flavobacterium sp. GB2R13]|uniref:hypothetical protein n=1 Tax=Flavobacterium algoris TaxID=3398733 RepID=UPI003A8AE6F4